MKTFTFAILACSKSKLDVPAPARELYTGALFKLALQYAESVADRVLILSAKHGVVESTSVLRPYDEKLPTEKHRLAVWGNLVAGQLQSTIAPGVPRANLPVAAELAKRVLCLAPQSYVSGIGFMYGPSWWHRPLKGLGIGSQKKWLIDRLAEAASADYLDPMERRQLVLGELPACREQP